MLQKEKSFTLMELLIVIAVIAILAAVVLVSLDNARQSAWEARGLKFSQTVKSGLGGDLVGEWSFDDGSGTAAIDSSGNNNNGTVSGSTWTNGKVRGALSFKGSSPDRVVIAHSSLLEPSSITIEFWANFVDKGTRHVIVTKWNGYTTELNADGTFKFGLNGLSGQYFGSKKVSFGKWHHFVGTFDNTTKKQTIYIDGQFSETQTPTGTISYNQQALQISWNYEARGIIDEVRIYKAALTARKIQQLYAQGLPRHLSKE